MRTPWGQSQHKKKIITGVNYHTTEGHGGFKVFKRLNALIPNEWRNENCWYEEDCEYCIPCMFIPAIKKEDPELYACAVKTCKKWYPDIYEKVFNVILKEGESYIKDEKQFYKDNENNLIGISAVGLDGKVTVSATIGGERDYSNIRRFTIDEDKYLNRGRFGYVIQEEDLKNEIKKS